MKMLLQLRDDFPMICDETIYLDTAATAHKPQVVIDALCDFYTKEYATVHRSVYGASLRASEKYRNARETVQHFLHAAYPEEIIFTRGTTASLNLLARSFAKAFLHPGDAIILSEIEHHSNLVPWQMIAEESGAHLRFIPVTDEGELILSELDNLLDEKAKLVSIAHISNAIGTLHPVHTVIEKAHAAEALVCLDGAQAAGHIPVDVQKLDVDFYAFSGHKIYGPTGVGVLYGKKHLLEQLPPIEGGGDMIEEVSLERASYNTLPLKFEAGTPMIAEVIALGAALDYLTSIELEKIASWERELLAYATEKLHTVPGLRIIGNAQEKGAIISFVIEGVHPLDIASLLDCRGIAIRSGHHCSQPTMDHFGLTATARLSFGLYNTFEEIDRTVTALTSIASVLST